VSRAFLCAIALLIVKERFAVLSGAACGEVSDIADFLAAFPLRLNVLALRGRCDELSIFSFGLDH